MSLSNINQSNLKEYLDEIVDKVNHLDFIALDPISIPHRFSVLQDIEISAFFAAMLAWGNRKTIINKTNELMNLMDERPYDFIINHSAKDLKPLTSFKHRTFQTTDLLYFINFLKRHYQEADTLEQAFYPRTDPQLYNQEKALMGFHDYFFEVEYAPVRTRKHVATPAKKSTCKRLNMYLRWMVRSDDKNVDFGLWKTIPTSELMIPLDVHVENIGRQLGIITRKQRDWTTVVELTTFLRTLDPTDPVKYDYALFGLGVHKGELD